MGSVVCVYIYIYRAQNGSSFPFSPYLTARRRRGSAFASGRRRRRGGDVCDSGAMPHEEGEAKAEAHRAANTAGADADHHPHDLRCRARARSPHHRRHVAPPQECWFKRIDEQAANENIAQMDEGETKAEADLQP